MCCLFFFSTIILPKSVSLLIKWNLEKTVPKLASLSPTTEDFKENIKQTHHQAYVWKHTLDSDLPDMSPTNLGWLFEETSQSRSPVTVPRGNGLVLEDNSQPIKCQYDTDGPC